MKLIRKNKALIRFATKMMEMKKKKPMLYMIISVITDSVVLGAFVLLSVMIALYLAIEGYMDFNTAMMGVCFIDA
ncbi:MAG: hypothetical protein K6A23_07760, partial [Butyrivibrio sp.]|nr:hypothetical protein [Butyrivibrio sp.]